MIFHSQYICPHSHKAIPQQAEVAKSSMKVAKSSRYGIEIYNGESSATPDRSNDYFTGSSTFTKIFAYFSVQEHYVK